MLAADTDTTNSVEAMANQSAPMAIMINGPSGRSTIRMEFWSDRISTGNAKENLKGDVHILRDSQFGYVWSHPRLRADAWGMDLGHITNCMWLVPDVGLVEATPGSGGIILTVHTAKTGSRSEARAQIEKAAVDQEDPYKGASNGESHSVSFRKELGRDFFFPVKDSVVDREFSVKMLTYTNQTWAIDIESFDGKAAHIVLDSDFTLRSAQRK